MIKDNEFIAPNERLLMIRIFNDYLRKRERTLLDQGRDYESYREKLYQIKKNSLENIWSLCEKSTTNLKKNGINVFWAKDAEEARVIIIRLTNDKKKIVKTKSNTFHEIDQEGFLADKELTETDLGDFLNSLNQSSGIHPVLPALNLSIHEIVNIIKRKFGVKIEANSQSIVDYIKPILRRKIIEADVAITGANAITADGQIILLENEGNISLATRIPSMHIIVSGFEKIVDSLSEAMELIEASVIWSTGQKFPSYVSIISGPSKTADINNELIIGAQGAKDVNLILVDNGRKELISAGLGELLYCLNCGACLNSCPVFREIGKSYGGKYLGSKGVIFTAFSESLLGAKKANCFSCTLCGACYDNCPVKIDLPSLMKKVREHLVNNDMDTDVNKKMIDNIRKSGNPFGEIKKGTMPDELYCC